MKYIIYLIVIAFVIYSGRKYIKGWILTRKELKNKKEVSVVNNDLIYTPILSSRTFYFAVQIDEVGDGKATLSIVKTKDL